MIVSKVVTSKPHPPPATDPVARIAQLEAELAQERRVSHALREVGTAVGSVVDLDQILELILAKVREVLEADRATLFLLDEGRRELVSRITTGDGVRTLRVKLGRGIAGLVAKNGRPVRIPDAYEDARFLRESDELTGYRTRAVLAAPLKNHLGRIVGVIQALNKQGDGEFSAEDEALLTALATQAAVTIDNSRLYLSALHKNMQLVETKEQLERRVRDLELLFDLESSMARAATLEGVLHAALEQATSACDAGAGAVLLPDEETEASAAYFYEDQHEDRAPAPLKRLMMSPGEGFLGSIMITGRAARENDINFDREGAGRTDRAVGQQTASALGSPLEGQDGRRLGAIALYNKGGGRPFSDEDLSLLRLVAANVSTAVQLHRSRTSQERAKRLTAIGQLLSGVIHDLKTPLAVISGYLQLMATTADEEERRGFSALVQRQFEQIRQMQREVLEFARGEKSVLVRRVYLQPFMRNVEQSVRPLVDGRPVTLAVRSDDPGTARFDEGKMARALDNLARNALDAMGERGGELTMRASREGDEIVFAVSDNGPGIPDTIRGRLFESFVTSGKKGGTGLGLAIVKKIITEEHGGRVEVETSASGTTFRLFLPQATASQEPDRG
jgi:signal transduction histidine kinase/putative methionine-R-sulfoxide reductase with GAF domain